MNKNSSGFIHILLIFLVVIAIGAFLFLGKDKLKSIVSIGTPVPSATVDTTANWKTYMDSKNNFSFEYPNDWNAKEAFLPQQKEITIVDLQTNDRNFLVGGKAADIFLNVRNNDVTNSELVGVGVKGQPQILTLGALTGRFYETSGGGDGGAYYVLDFIFTNKGLTYWMSLNTESSNKNVFLPIFNQILSTFKFTP